jgi:hypothetical protein
MISENSYEKKESAGEGRRITTEVEVVAVNEEV